MDTHNFLIYIFDGNNWIFHDTKVTYAEAKDAAHDLREKWTHVKVSLELLTL